jgi:hypothetical protein
MVWILTVLLIYAALAVALWVLTRFFQGYVYTEIPADLHWRAPAAAGVVWFVALVWPLAFNALSKPQDGGVKWPITFNDLFVFSIQRTELEFDEFVVPSAATLTGRETTYYREKTPRGAVEYRTHDSDRRLLPRPVPELIGRTKDGRAIPFKIVHETRRPVFGPEVTQTRYVNEEQGLVMTDEEFGRITTSRAGQLFLNVLALLLTGAAWFLALWLVLLFQWPHALGLSVPALLLFALVLNPVFP